MLKLSTMFQDGWPALLVMLGCILVLVVVRFGVPYLIQKFQRKRPLTKKDNR
ncbi:MAG TPA: hypothetical protein PLN95_01900 [Candidatus Saccharibacteria bacterium]|nr:hypothetical protein [Candidatus Saccharibacteria bacterium]